VHGEADEKDVLAYIETRCASKRRESLHPNAYVSEW
jgi:hypothetical protein